MDFINVSNNFAGLFFFFSVFAFLLWTYIFLSLDGIKTLIVSFIVWIILLIVIVAIPAIGAVVFEATEYYEPKQIETIYYQNGEVEQFAYRHNGERVNIGEAYGITMHEETMYREWFIDYSWAFWNFESFIVGRADSKVFDFSADGTFDN